MRLLLWIGLAEALCGGTALAQPVVEFTFGAATDAAVGDTASVAVEVRGFQDTRAVEVRLGYDAARFEPVGAVAPADPALRVVHAGPAPSDSGAVYRIVLAHLDPAAFTSSIRRRTLVTLRGRRLAAGPLAFRFERADPAVVSRARTTQAVAYGAALTSAPAAAPGPLAARLTGVAPNPFRTRTRVGVEAPTAGTGVLRVFDALGRQVAAHAVTLAPGVNALDVDGGALAAGLYVFRVDVAGSPRPLAGTFVRLP